MFWHSFVARPQHASDLPRYWRRQLWRWRKEGENNDDGHMLISNNEWFLHSSSLYLQNHFVFRITFPQSSLRPFSVSVIVMVICILWYPVQASFLTLPALLTPFPILASWLNILFLLKGHRKDCKLKEDFKMDHCLFFLKSNSFLLCFWILMSKIDMKIEGFECGFMTQQCKNDAFWKSWRT